MFHNSFLFLVFMTMLTLNFIIIIYFSRSVLEYLMTECLNLLFVFLKKRS